MSQSRPGIARYCESESGYCRPLDAEPVQVSGVALPLLEHLHRQIEIDRGHVDWAALGVVTVVSIVTSVIFTILLASGIRLVSLDRSAVPLVSGRTNSHLVSPTHLVPAEPATVRRFDRGLP
jgi:hypothetical protein